MSNTATLIDDFGLLSAQIAELEAKKKLLHKQIIELGEGAHEGTFFRVTVSKSIRETLDMAAVREKLSRQFILANTKETEVISVRGSMRNAANLVAQAMQAAA